MSKPATGATLLLHRGLTSPSKAPPKMITLADLGVPTIQDMRRSWEDSVEIECMCREIVYELALGTYPDVAAQYLDQLAIPFTTQSVLTDIVEALGFAFLEREPYVVSPLLGLAAADRPPHRAEDASETSTDESEPAAASVDHLNFVPPTKLVAAPPAVVRLPSPKDESVAPHVASERRRSSGCHPVRSEAGWEPAPVAEPRTVPPDSWCRATIQQRRRLSDSRSSVNVDGPRSAVTAVRRHLGILGATRRGSPNSEASPSGQRTPSSSLAGTLRSRPTPFLIRRPTSAGNGRNVRAIDEPLSDSDGSPRSVANEQQTREPLAAEKEAQMTSLRTLSDNVHKQLTQLRPGSGFVVDALAHKVVEIVPVDVKSLPPQRAEVKATLIEPDEPPGEAPKSQAPKEELADLKSDAMGASMRPASRVSVLRGRPKKTQGDAGSITNFWRPEPNSNPMISAVQPAAGVTHREGDVVRHAELKPQKNRLSRAEYAKIVSLQLVTATTQGAAIDEAPIVASPTNPTVVAEQPSTATVSGASKGDAAVNNEAGPSKTSHANSAPNTRVATPVLVQRPSSQAHGNVRHPTGGVHGVMRTPLSRVSTPAPSAKRPVFPERPRSQQSFSSAKDEAPHTGNALHLRAVADTEDDVARDFILSYASLWGDSGL